MGAEYQSFNRYSYCYNNPLKYSDPSGYNAWKFEENPYQTFSSNPGVFRINWNICPYRYDWNTQQYYNSKGEVVTYDEVFVNYIQPNSISFNSYISSINSGNIKHSESKGNQQNQVNANNFLADLKKALLDPGGMMFNGSWEQILSQENDLDQDKRVNLLTSENVISELFDRIQMLNREGNLLNLYDVIRPNGYGKSSPLGRFYKNTFNIGGFEYQVFIYAYSERQISSFYNIEQMGFGYLDRCSNYTPDKRINGGYYIGFFMINTDCCNLITIGAQNLEAYYYLNSYFHSFDN